MEQSFTLAKLTRPRLYRTLPRERLFLRLDEAREHQAVWIASSPGSGKTSLVSSYLETRKLNAVWYQIDSGDADPASFFYYLAMAAGSLLRTAHLPLLAPEYLSDLPGFTRRFFRELFHCLPHPGALIFDNYHAVPLTSVLHGIMRDAMEEVPQDVNIIVTSRLEPPDAFLRLQLSRSLISLDRHDLQISMDEAHKIALLEGVSPEEVEQKASSLREMSGGWAAGFVLMLSQHRSVGSAQGASLPMSRQALFDYFAVEIFSAASPEAQHLLLRTAFLPLITVPMAEAISGDLEAGQQLNELYRLRYFIDRRDEPEVTYQYHALFREFLLARACRQLDAAECLLLQRRSARLLEIGKRPEDALPLYVATQDWPAATRLIRQHAHELIQHGRWQTVKAWIDQLPAGALDADPWLRYWRGICDAAIDPGEARGALEKAYAGLKAQDDTAGQIRAISAIMETYYFQWSSFAPLDHWIDLLNALLADGAEFSSPEAELSARSALLAALLYRQPQHPLLMREAARTFTLLAEDVPAGVRFASGTILLNCYCFRGNLDYAEHVVGLLRPHLAHAQVSPLNQVWWRIATAYYLLLRAEHNAAATVLKEAADIAREYHLTFIEPVVLTQRAILALSFCDLDCARQLIPQLEASIDPQRRMDVALFHSVKSWYHLARNELAAALKHGQTAVDCAFETGAVTIQTYCLIARAQLLLEAGELEHAGASARGMRLRAGEASLILTFDALLIEAYAALKTGDAAAGLPILRAGLAIGRGQGYVNTLRWQPKIVSPLLRRALEEGIEVDYAKQLIRVRGLQPDTPDSEQWPWPIKLYTLGRFSIAIEDTPAKTSGKAQAKPLELLKALIAHGGREASAAMLAGDVWPDVEGDAAQHALNTSLHRLRKLLRHDDAITMHEGKLSLNQHIVWVDVWAFERLANQLEHKPCDCLGVADKFFRLYPGNFLERETQASWALPLRERLRGKFLRQALSFGHAWEQAGDWDRAVAAYQRGIEIDNLSEELYRSLMLCHRRRGETAAAIEVYRRCRQMLSVVLGVKPSAETEAAYLASTQE
ncbi:MULTISPECIES: BTAD domain-containing putative transcriptional regulator [unclassified Janthinobacterium]|uniref:BTAD domain-containing putative transcriptional regulator n=1 Tax=unclassified Janthinobacterium TaxID=2610881 RepID=UPI0009D962EC|nr:MULTISPECIES: BTAD domain-containing putative transcriptional regulator [unclassified Janthinobacterium]MEC5159814.1 LuxR family maltose regulon positive regulatory protein [Janthinobacterium sp. CG_S6]